MTRPDNKPVRNKREGLNLTHGHAVGNTWTGRQENVFNPQMHADLNECICPAMHTKYIT